jgi:glycolate oxidase iron-sulfur subunit
MMQIGSAAGIPVVHTVELLDWATGGPRPSKMDADQTVSKIPNLR